MVSVLFYNLSPIRITRFNPDSGKLAHLPKILNVIILFGNEVDQIRSSQDIHTVFQNSRISDLAFVI